MLLVVNPDFVQKVFDIFEKWDLEYSLVGVVNYSGKYNIIDNNENVLYEEDITNFTDILEDWPENRIENNFPIIEKIRNKSLWEQYDTTIGCRTIKGPQQSKSFAILDIYEIKKHILITWGSSVDECLKYVRAFLCLDY